MRLLLESPVHPMWYVRVQFEDVLLTGRGVLVEEADDGLPPLGWCVNQSVGGHGVNSLLETVREELQDLLVPVD